MIFSNVSSRTEVPLISPLYGTYVRICFLKRSSESRPQCLPLLFPPPYLPQRYQSLCFSVLLLLFFQAFTSTYVLPYMQVCSTARSPVLRGVSYCTSYLTIQYPTLPYPTVSTHAYRTVHIVPYGVLVLYGVPSYAFAKTDLQLRNVLYVSLVDKPLLILVSTRVLEHPTRAAIAQRTYCVITLRKGLARSESLRIDI